MAKRTTRRTVSLNGLVYQRLKKHCDSIDAPVSRLVQTLVEEYLNEQGVPQETVLKRHFPKPRRPRIESQYKEF